MWRRSWAMYAMTTHVMINSMPVRTVSPPRLCRVSKTERSGGMGLPSHFKSTIGNSNNPGITGRQAGWFLDSQSALGDRHHRHAGWTVQHPQCGSSVSIRRKVGLATFPAMLPTSCAVAAIFSCESCLKTSRSLSNGHESRIDRSQTAATSTPAQDQPCPLAGPPRRRHPPRAFEQGEIGPDLFRAACDMMLEGLVSKRRDSQYRAGPSRDWIKVKNPKSPAMNRAKDAFS
jgi:hypothetical protein